MVVVLLDAPRDLQLDLPPTVRVKRQVRGRADVVVAFFTNVAKLEHRMDALSSIVYPSGSLWIAWPKRTSGVRTDMTDDAVRSAALRRGLVDNKVCAIDATWSSLRVVWRRERRA
ncbi:MAG: DUF3052 domain-containing protein [Acidimicrobiales bacterium]